ncbi:formate dehydrogenase accessory sulfurtransferase FdhD [uncultured Nitrospira sp.]|uniref:formate dehydrogenase accessory sulfurtransferase FdhD n=1 Tax=uncultured Nitrospira sp. TaxID=157176 RepID=UPI00314071E2
MATKLYSTHHNTLSGVADSPASRSRQDTTARQVLRSGTGQLAVEEPLEIRLEYWTNGVPQQKSVSITMRTPGHDVELAAGFLFTEGIIAGWNDIKHIRPCGPIVEGEDFQNIVRVKLHSTVTVKTTTMDRNFYTTSSCGICGKTSIEALKINNQFGQTIKHLTSPSVTPNMLFCLPERMTARQLLFQQTGGCHASGLFDEKGALLCVREDVGRHNALDKVIGWALMNNLLPLHNHVVLVSGRASFELMQKSSMGGIPFVAAVGAPSTLAVQMAEEFNMTLVGFLDRRRMTVYHDSGRIQDHQAPQSEDTGGRTTRHTGSPVNSDVGNPDRRFPRP